MTYRCKCFKNPPLGVLGDSRQIELSSSIFLLRLQFNTLLALGNILGSILYLKIQKYLLKKFPEPLKFDPTWFGTPSGHKLSVKKIWLINFFVSDFVNLWFLVLRNISNNQRPDFVSGILLSWIQCSHRKNWHLFTHSHIYTYIYSLLMVQVPLMPIVTKQQLVEDGQCSRGDWMALLLSTATGMTKKRFGDLLIREIWLGLDKIYRLTPNETENKLRVEWETSRLFTLSTRRLALGTRRVSASWTLAIFCVS